MHTVMSTFRVPAASASKAQLIEAMRRDRPNTYEGIASLIHKSLWDRA